MRDTTCPYYVYVLWSATTERFYIGVTEDVAKRVRQHNEGVSRWTRGRGPWEVVWSREFCGLGAAREFENLLKRQKGGSGFFALAGLAREEFGRGKSGS